MAQNRYPAYTTYEAGPAYFNGPINAPPRVFDARPGPPPAAAKQMEPGMQAILNGDHGARHPMPRPFDTSYTYPGYEGSFHGTSIDQGLHALLSGHRPYASPRDSVAYSNPIANFYHDADGPWNSVRATNQARSSAASANVALAVPGPNLDYNSYRHAPASEISDSGYASQAAASQSVVNANTEPTDYSRECGDLPVQVNSFSFTAAAHSPPSYDTTSFQTRNADCADLSSASQPTASQKQLQCPRCGNVAKCRSDFKKHELKHTKPHVCNEPNCPRKEGFATSNDLDRHKKSVHNAAGKTKSFRCAADRCKNKDKIWPRLDNFKQHVERMHHGSAADMADIIQRSQFFGDTDTSDPGPSGTRSASPMDNALAGIGSKSKDSPAPVVSQGLGDDSSNALVSDLNLSSSHEYSRPRQWEEANFRQYQDDYPQPLRMSGDQQLAQNSQSDASRLRQLAVAATAASQAANQLDSKDDSQATGSKAQSSKRTSAIEDGQKRLYSKFSNIIASSIANGNANESLNKAVLRALLELDQNKHIITTTSNRKGSAAKEAKTSRGADKSPPGFREPGRTEITMSTAEVKTALAALSKSFAQRRDVAPIGKTGKPQGVKCTECPRVCARRCDLRKHLKRHSKPYGCTFSKCYKEFGSKNDWRRHEDGQHWQLETWRCEQPPCDERSTCSSPPSLIDDDSSVSSNVQAKVCGHLFYDSNAFSIHLRSQHSFPKDQISTELCIRRIGRNNQSRFWCGFCERVLELNERGQAAWSERYNHISHHFDKEDKHIRDWLDIDTNKRKGSLERATDRHNVVDGKGDGQDNKEGEFGRPGLLRKAAEISDADVLILAVPKDKGGDGSDGGSTAVAGRKRSHKEMESNGGDDDGHARAHTDERASRPRGKSKQGQLLFFCCGCNQGPYAWSLYQSCLDCEHEFCTSCDRRIHESSAEENIDYNPWNHLNVNPRV
ncbi:c2h2 type zinc finger domain protein [Diplodia corticola]|uniref:C2h2 type zinc finger domain protein n=1 Tax=Diplodia corticola TaxID=236234 RepID=A0A1J9QMH3_9PEZI|nr:c2h2 type zinc finger domain protein [Diplodia corticola]OJD29266.1 c2h2 type zinc finger domain protein [Diplodia corticola]